MSETIEQTLITELSDHHVKTQALIERARNAVKEATESAAYMGVLIDKVAASKKSTVYQWMSEHAKVDGQAARSYSLAHKTSLKRLAHSDRRCLLHLGILESQISSHKPERVKRPPVSLNTKIHRANSSILEHVKTRPVGSMSANEKLVLKNNLEALAKLYVEASR